MSRLFIIVVILIFCVGCSGPTKTGKEARIMAHLRMDAVNAGLAAQQAKQQFEVGQLDAALETIDAAIERFSDYAAYHLLRSRILIEQHRLALASISLERTIELDPEMAKPHYFLGVIHQRLSDDQTALTSYQRAMQLDTHPQYIMATAETLVALDRYDDAIEVLQGAGEFRHQPAVSSLMGHIYLQKGDPVSAAEQLASSLLLGNNDEGTLTALATAQFQAALYADCLVTLTQLHEELDEGLAPMFVRMKGKCFAATGHLIKGRDICLEVTRLTPNRAGAWIDLGYIAWEMGDYKRVHNCGIHITNLDPSMSEGPLFVGVAALHNGDQDLAVKMLSLAQTDNEFQDLDTILQSIGSGEVKTGQETYIGANMSTQTAEGSKEQYESNSVIMRVLQDSLHAP